jgi:hypothetical protein
MADPARERDRRRLQTAFHHAALVHEQSAVLHAAAAEVFEHADNHAASETERRLASMETAAAEADHQRAAEQIDRR